MRLLLPWLGWVGCSAEETLLIDLDGRWDVVMRPLDAPSREATATLVWDAEEASLSGDFEVMDPDTVRSFALRSADDINQLGIALEFLETGGVRRMFMNLRPPTQQTTGPWQVQWGCDEAYGLCTETGDAEWVLR